MANAGRDQNNVPTLLAASSADGKTIVPIQVEATNHHLLADDNIVGTDHGRAAAVRDDNFVPVLMAVSSVDGVTPVEVYGDPLTGKILVDSA